MLADVVLSLRFFQYRPTKKKALKWSNSVLFSVTYFSQFQAVKLRSAILSWDEPMTFEFQVGTANESLQWKLWRLRTTVAYRTWCCILNIALEKFLLPEFQVFHWHKTYIVVPSLCYHRYQNWLFSSEGILWSGFWAVTYLSLSHILRSNGTAFAP
jgi:hypothetical protein